ncbi:hypothetical protein BC938DRAFT_479279 [Jimgerdemannia flammicorona]|uniref:Uncharacterized protein n=1 Tax=Jimgerdemannia flammicorona TaxID=994334 RepID=A0A433QL84_9FUNG|nr:hypothetical protein BC938DRAFT_479279 [Jimgerdemannia flammicorona]
MYTPQQQQQQGQPASYGHHVGMAAAQHAAYNIMGNPNMAGMSVHTRDQIAAYHAQQQHQQMASGTIVRKRTNEFNDAAIETFVPESRLYNELVEFEKRLDATIMRKRLDIQEAMGKPVKTKRTLRVFLSNMASDQPSQLQSDADEDNVDLGSGGAPSWTLKIEGRLLDVS